MNMPRRRIASLLAALLLTCPGLRGQTVEAELRDAAGQPVEHAVVSLKPLDAPAPPASATPVPGVEIAQIGEQYRPYVTAVRVGTSVAFPNKDDIQHHIYSVSKAKPFEKPLYDSGSSESVVFDRPGVVTLGCNIHDWMVAYVVVLETPYFVVSPADGRAVLPAPPPGRYSLEVWHPRLTAPVVREITVAAGTPAKESFELKLKPDRRVRRAPSGEAKTY